MHLVHGAWAFYIGWKGDFGDGRLHRKAAPLQSKWQILMEGGVLDPSCTQVLLLVKWVFPSGASLDL